MTMPLPPWESHVGTATTLTEETDYLAALAAATDRVRIVSLGSSAQGRPLRAVIVGPPRTRDEVRASTRYMVLGSHHGDEWAGREAVFEDMRRHALGGGDETVVYLPTVNPDSVNTPLRELANGIDPNRLWSPTGVNQTTSGGAYQPEQQAVRQALLLWQPQLIVDTHEYDTSADGTGTTYRLDPGTNNATGTPQATIDVVQALLTQVRGEATGAGYAITNYTGTIPADGGTQAWKIGGIPATFTESPRESSGGLTLRRAQQLTSLEALRRYVRTNRTTLDTVSQAATWYSGYAPTVQDSYTPTGRAQAVLVGVSRNSLNGTGTVLEIPCPQDVQDGDYLVAIGTGASETVAAAPTGWDPMVPFATADYGPNLYVMTRRVQGAQPASWPWTVPSVKSTVIVTAWRGVDPTTPLDVAAALNVSATAWPGAPAVTTTTPDATVVTVGAVITASGDLDMRWSSDGDEDVRVTSQASGTTNTAVVSASRVVPDPGTVTPTLAPADPIIARGGAITFALRPAAYVAPEPEPGAIGAPRFGPIAAYPLDPGGTQSAPVVGTSNVTYPSNVAVGEFLTVAIPARVSAEAAPDYSATGWNLLKSHAGTNARMTFLWKTAEQVDVDRSAAGTPLAVSGELVLRTLKMMAVPGVHPTSPIDGAATLFSEAASGTVASMPSQTPTSSGALLVWGASGFLGTTTTFTPTRDAGEANPNAVEWLDQWQDRPTPTTEGRAGAAYYEPWDAATPTGNRGVLSTTSSTLVGVYFVLRPAGAVTPEGPVVDLWNGTVLVRQRIDLWNGTTLMQQSLTA